MPGAPYRITIQLDLSGYSFSIYDRNGILLSEESHSCPVDLSVKELEPVLGRQFSMVSVYFTTWKYTLVPQSRFIKENVRMYLDSVRDVGERETVLTLDLPSRKAVMVFAIPAALCSAFNGLCRNVRFYPTAYLLIDRIASVEDNNRLIVAFTDGMLHIVAAERDKLMFANSFPAGDIATAEYFIFSVVREVMFNPEHTILYVYGKVDETVEAELRKYFSGVRFLS